MGEHVTVHETFDKTVNIPEGKSILIKSDGSIVIGYFKECDYVGNYVFIGGDGDLSVGIWYKNETGKLDYRDISQLI